MSLLGNSITAIALPLVVLFTTGSPVGAGVVAIASAVPAAFAGLLMGALVDRINRRTVAILSDVISAVALLILPIVHLTIGLNLGWFIAVAILNSFGDVPGITAREAMLPAIAKAAKLDPSRLIGIRESLSGASLLLGPGVAGILVAALEPVSVLWITSGLAVSAALLTFVIPPRAAVFVGETVEAPSSTSAMSMFRGMGIIFRSPLLRGLVLLGLALAIVLAATQGMVMPVHFAVQGEPQFVGFVLSALAAGLLVGGGIFAALGHRIPRCIWFIAGLILVAAGFSIIAILGPVWSIFAGAVAAGIGGGAMNAVIGLAFVENVPDVQRGTVLGAQNALMVLVPALGIGAAAVLIEAGGIQLAAVALAGLWILAAIAALLTPRLRRLGQAEA